MATGMTKLTNLIDPEVMAPMISAKLEKAIVATPFARIDTTLVGQPGDTITVPKYAYIGEAEDVAEGVEAGTTVLTTTTANYKVKKAMKAVTLTDEAVLSAYGNPVGETNNQLGMSIADKVDNDVIDALLTASLVKDESANSISYLGVVDALDAFQEEENVEKVMFINPTQSTELRKDENFISRDKYGNQVMIDGEIGMIANTRIVPTRKIVAKNGKFTCPIVQLRPESQTGDETAAVTIYMKKGVSVETERHTLSRTTDISVDQHYIAALTDESKVVLAQFKAPATSL